ncbi:type II secretion system protein [bacterium]|nr:type II secretion system protein [bacterium]
MAKNQKGFTLIELLLASFIFTSLLVVVYGILTGALRSRKELEMTVVLGQNAKNITETIRSAVREANGDLLDGSDFWPTLLDKKANLFFASKDFLDPGNTQHNNAVLRKIRGVLNHSARGRYLYIKDERSGKIYVFWLDDSGETGKIKVKNWVEEEEGGRTIWREEGVGWSELGNFDKNKRHFFQITAKPSQKKVAKSIFDPQTEIRPFDLWVKMEVTLVEQWGKKTYWRELKQVFVPLVKANPYL